MNIRDNAHKKGTCFTKIKIFRRETNKHFPIKKKKNTYPMHFFISPTFVKPILKDLRKEHNLTLSLPHQISPNQHIWTLLNRNKSSHETHMHLLSPNSLYVSLKHPNTIVRNYTHVHYQINTKMQCSLEFRCTQTHTLIPQDKYT